MNEFFGFSRRNELKTLNKLLIFQTFINLLISILIYNKFGGNFIYSFTSIYCLSFRLDPGYFSFVQCLWNFYISLLSWSVFFFFPVSSISHLPLFSYWLLLCTQTILVAVFRVFDLDLLLYLVYCVLTSIQILSNLLAPGIFLRTSISHPFCLSFFGIWDSPMPLSLCYVLSMTFLIVLHILPFYFFTFSCYLFFCVFILFCYLFYI